jgi:hypothetical protein
MLGYEEEAFELEKRLSQAMVDGDDDERVYVAKLIQGLGGMPCAVCGTLIRIHPYEGWLHEDQGMDHDARPDRAGFDWPPGLPLPGGRTGS